MVDGSNWLADSWSGEKCLVSPYFEGAKGFESRGEARRLQRDLNDDGWNFQCIGISKIFGNTKGY